LNVVGETNLNNIVKVGLPATVHNADIRIVPFLP